MTRVAALETQKSLRDLAGLPRLCADVAWLDPEALAAASEPAFIVGIWLTNEPAAAKQLIARRSTAGLLTVLVPRFKGGDLRAVLKTPTSVRVRTGEFDSFSWEGGETIAVSGQTVLETTLHASQCGSVAGLGVTVLTYRAHEAAGAIVLCTAGLTSRQLGVDVTHQRRLWELIIDRVGSPVSRAVPGIEQPPPSPAASLDELLGMSDAKIAAVVLAVALGGGNREPNAVAAAASRLGFVLGDQELRQALARMPEASVAVMEHALQKHGWGAFLRRGRMALTQAGGV
jgi:hypothetical protein